MANIKIVGDAIVITSSKTLEEIKTLEKYSPKALSLYETAADGTSCEYFRVATTNSGAGSINIFGASFAKADADGKGVITLTMDFKADDDVVGIVSDTFGTALLRLNEVEAGVDAALEEVNRNKAAILEHIAIV